MNTKITLNNGVNSYGYSVDQDSLKINFLIVAKNAVICDTKQYIKYFSPEADQFGDSHVFKYRNYNLYGRVLDNKVNGVYVHTVPAPVIGG